MYHWVLNKAVVSASCHTTKRAYNERLSYIQFCSYLQLLDRTHLCQKSRSSRSDVFCEKITLKNLSKLTKSTRAGVFFEESCRPKFLRTIFFKEHLWCGCF